MAQELTRTDKNEVAQDGGREATRSGLRYRPNTDIFESEDDVVVTADMPGVKPGDVDITLERGVLTIRGHVEPKAPEGYRLIHAEYGVGDFERVFNLSEDIDQDRIEANLKHGVLSLELPKAAAAMPKKIEVKAA